MGVLNDLYVVPGVRGGGTGAALIERCRELCREHGAAKLVWRRPPTTPPPKGFTTGVGAEKSAWLSYELDA